MDATAMILPVTSFSMAATTFVGQNYGAGNLKRVKKWHVTLGMGVLYTLCTGARCWRPGT